MSSKRSSQPTTTSKINSHARSHPILMHTAVWRTKIAGFLFGAYAATIGLRISVGGLQLPTFILAVAILFAILVFGVTRIPRLRFTGVDLVAVCYALGRILVEVISAERLEHSSNVQGVLNTTYGLVVYFCVRLVVQDKSSLRNFLSGLATPSIVVSLIAIAQIAGVGPVSQWVISNTNSVGAAERLTDGRLTRATSLIGHWSGLGGYLACIIAICGVVMVLDRGSRRISRVMLVSIAFASAAAVTTFTLAVMAIVLVTLIAVLAAMGYRVRGLVIVAVGVVLAAVFFGDSLESRFDQQSTETRYLPPQYSWLPATLSVRIHYWLTQGLPAFAEQPLWGWGHSVYGSWTSWPIRPRTLDWPYPESEFMKALVGGGAIELLLLGALLLSWGLLIRRGAPAFGQGASSILRTFLVCVTIGAAINPYFTNPGLTAVIWALMGALAWSQPRLLMASRAIDSSRHEAAPSAVSGNSEIETIRTRQNTT